MRQSQRSRPAFFVHRSSARGAEPFIVDGAKFDSLPGVTVHAFDYPSGRHPADLRGSGAYVILGIVKP